MLRDDGDGDGDDNNDDDCHDKNSGNHEENYQNDDVVDEELASCWSRYCCRRPPSTFNNKLKKQ